MNMYNWVERMIYGPKKPLPLLSFPSVQYLFITVKELVSSRDLQDPTERARYSSP